MVSDVEKLGELLKLPNLEQETIELINAKMREFISGVKPSVTFAQIPPNVLQEWTEGAQKKEGE